MTFAPEVGALDDVDLFARGGGAVPYEIRARRAREAASGDVFDAGLAIAGADHPAGAVNQADKFGPYGGEQFAQPYSPDAGLGKALAQGHQQVVQTGGYHLDRVALVGAVDARRFYG